MLTMNAVSRFGEYKRLVIISYGRECIYYKCAHIERRCLPLVETLILYKLGQIGLNIVDLSCSVCAI